MAQAALPSFRTQAFIDGAYRDAASGATFVSENPATGKPIANIASGDATDIDAAVARVGSAASIGSRPHILAKSTPTVGSACVRPPARYA